MATVLRPPLVSGPQRKRPIPAVNYFPRPLTLGITAPSVRFAQLSNSAPRRKSRLSVDVFPNLLGTTLTPAVPPDTTNIPVVQLYGSAPRTRIRVTADVYPNLLSTTLRPALSLPLAAMRWSYSAPQRVRAVPITQPLYRSIALNPVPRIAQWDASAPPPKYQNRADVYPNLRFSTLQASITLTVAGANHDHTAGAPVLTQTNTLSLADTLHAHAADSITLSQATNLSVAGAAHAHTAANVALVQANVLVVSGAQHAHAVENVTLVQGQLLSVANALHAHAADGVTLTQAHLLAVASALHGHTANSLGLTQANTLIVNNALHAHLAGLVSLQLGGRPHEAVLFVVRAQGRTFVVASSENSFVVSPKH